MYHILPCNEPSLVCWVGAFAALAIKIVVWVKKTVVDEGGVANEEEPMLGRYILSFMDPISIVGMILLFLGGMLFNAVLWTDIAVHVSCNER